MCGTAEFLAPEIINFEDISLLTDMWAVGVICYILMSGYSPFLGDTDGDTYNNIARSGTVNTFGYFYLQNTDLSFNSRCSYDFDVPEFAAVSGAGKEFISSLLVKEPSKRLSATEVINHKPEDSDYCVPRNFIDTAIQ